MSAKQLFPAIPNGVQVAKNTCYPKARRRLTIWWLLAEGKTQSHIAQICGVRKQVVSDELRKSESQISHDWLGLDAENSSASAVAHFAATAATIRVSAALQKDRDAWENLMGPEGW